MKKYVLIIVSLLMLSIFSVSIALASIALPPNDPGNNPPGPSISAEELEKMRVLDNLHKDFQKKMQRCAALQLSGHTEFAIACRKQAIKDYNEAARLIMHPPRLILPNSKSPGQGNKEKTHTDINIPAGDDHFRVTDAGFNVPLPADFFGPGSEPFEGTIMCGGDGDNSADTTIRRLGDIILPPPPSEDTIPIEIIELNLVSCQPITVNNNDSSQQQWDVRVSLPPALPPLVPFPLGQMIIQRTHENGGTFDAQLPVQPRFTFTRVGEGETTEPGTIVGDSPLEHGSDFITEPQPVIWEAEFNAFVFRAHAVSWGGCMLEPTVFCPGPVALSSTNNSWLHLEPVVLTLPDEDNCPFSAAPINPIQYDINGDGVVDDRDVNSLQSLVDVNEFMASGVVFPIGPYDEKDTEVDVDDLQSLMDFSRVFFDKDSKPLYSYGYSEGGATSLSIFQYQHDDPATDEDESGLIESVRQYKVKGESNELTGVVVLKSADINSDGLVDEQDVGLLESALKSVRDINGDGMVDSRDVIALQLLIDTLAGADSPEKEFTSGDPMRADINKDGLIDGKDTESLESVLKSLVDLNEDGVIDERDPQRTKAICPDIEGLYDKLQNTEIQAGVKNSLLAKVNSALSSLTTGKVLAAINQLGAFINQVEAQSGKKISQEEATVLAGFAQNIIQVNTVQLACMQPPSGIIGWWSGDNTLDLINGNNAVLHDDAGFAAGKVGNAFNFDGIGDYASIPYSSDLDPSEITVEFWVSGPQMNQQPGNAGSGVTLIENSAANHQGWSIFVTDPAAYTGGIGVVIGDGTQWNPIISTVGLWYPASGWRHVAMTYNGTHMQLYLNGVPQFGSGSGKPVSNAQLSTGGDINIGASWNNGSFTRFFKGLIDEVEIYDRALTVAEIQSIFNAGSAGKCKPNVCVAPPSNLVGWWTMDDAAGSSVVVDRANGNDGTTVNGATLGVPGKVSTAADFDGVDDYIEVPDHPDLNITDAITIDAWVKLDSLPNPSGYIKVIVSDDVMGGNPLGYALYVESTGRIVFRYSPIGLSWPFYFVSSTGTLSIGVWHHVAATLDSNASVMNIYIDGQLDKHVDNFNMPPIDPFSGPLIIGSTVTTPSQANFDGKIDEVEIFNRALSPFEIWSIYNAGTAGKCKSLTPVPVPNDPVE